MEISGSGRPARALLPQGSLVGIRMRSRQLALLAALLLAGLRPSAAAAWTAALDGSAAGAQDRARAVAADPAGNVFAVGLRQQSASGDSFEIVKLARGTGAVLWTRSIGPGEAMDVAADSAGNVIAVGAVDGGDGNDDFAVIKRSPTGATLWDRLFDGTARGDDRALAVQVDSNDDVLAVGRLRNADAGDDFTVMKFDGQDGGLLWSQVLDHAGADDEARAVRLDSADDVAAGGVFTDLQQDTDFAVARFAGATGALLWSEVTDGGMDGPDEASFLEIDSLGDVFAGGFETTPAGEQFTVRKYRKQTGLVSWTFHTGSGGDRVLGMSIEPVGNILATGTIDGVFSVVKVRRSDGTERWFSSVSTAAGSEGRAVAVAANGDVFVTGVENDDLLITRLERINGDRIWIERLGGSAAGPDEPFDVALDPQEDVLVAGVLANAGTLDDFAVIKRAGADGVDFVPEPSAAGVLLVAAAALAGRARRRGRGAGLKRGG